MRSEPRAGEGGGPSLPAPLVFGRSAAPRDSGGSKAAVPTEYRAGEGGGRPQGLGLAIANYLCTSAAFTYTHNYELFMYVRGPIYLLQSPPLPPRGSGWPLPIICVRRAVFTYTHNYELFMYVCIPIYLLQSHPHPHPPACCLL